MQTTPEIHWHNGRAYAQCPTCGKPVRVNKPVLGTLHLCLTPCEIAGRHLDVKTRRRGPFWRRYTQTYCAIEGNVIATSR